MKPSVDIVKLFDEVKSEGRYLKVAAPMVRYSKLQFRQLVRKYGVDLCFTPIIMADSFCQSSCARRNEFTTSTDDSPLIVQFAAKDPHDFLGATRLLHPYVDGVDLNCGCPQSWAMKDGYGCSLLFKPEIIHTLIREVKNTMPSSFSVSVKVRLLKSMKETINLCKQIEKCSASFLTIHGRTPSQKSSEKVNIEALREVCSLMHIPIIANGGVKNLSNADSLYESVNCEGVMAASGLLSNPALFTRESKTPVCCVQNWLKICSQSSKRISFQCFHHHLVFMLEKILTKQQKQVFNFLTSHTDVENYLAKIGIIPDELDVSCGPEVECEYSESLVNHYQRRKCEECRQTDCICSDCYDSGKSNGKYFSSLIKKGLCDLDHMESSLFDEPI